MVATDYNIHTQSNGALIAEANFEGPNNVTRGDTATFEFYFPSVKTISGTFSIPAGETRSYQKLVVPDGATLDNDGTLLVNQLIVDGTVDNTGTIITGETQHLLQDYDDWSGGYVTNQYLDSTVRFREQIPTSADVDSILLGIEPNGELQDRQVIGVWGLIQDITDNRPLALNQFEFRVEVEIIAEYDEYADHTAINNALSI